MKVNADYGLRLPMEMNSEAEHTRELMNAYAINSAIAKDNQVATAIKDAVRDEIGKLIGVIESKPETVAYEPGMILRERGKDGIKIIQTEPDWRWKPGK